MKTLAKNKDLKSGSLHRLVRRLLQHPIWHYSPREILRCIKEDWEGTSSRSELEDLIKHIDIHSNYERGGYEQMTTKEKYIFTKTVSKPWSWERDETPNDSSSATIRAKEDSK